MLIRLRFSLFLLTALLGSCGQDNPEQPTPPAPTITPDSTEVAPAPTLLYPWVDNLNLREAPKTSATVVAKANSGDALIYLEEQTDFTEEIKLRGKTYDEPWVKVRTSEGQEGWVFAGALKREGEIKGTAKQIKGVIDIPHFGRHDLRVWSKESTKDSSGGDAEATTTIYSSGNWVMEVMTYDTGEYGYGKHYRLIGPDSELLKAYNLEWISDTPHLLKETVWDFTTTPARKFVRSESFDQHFFQLKPRPESVDGDFEETTLSPEEVKKEQEYL